MRVRSGLESQLQSSTLVRPRGPRLGEALTPPVSPQQPAERGANPPVEGAAGGRLDANVPRSPGARVGSAQADERRAEERRAERPNLSPGFTQPAEGARPSASFDKLEISTEARRKTVDEEVRANFESTAAALRNGTQSTPVTSTVASTLDLRV